MRDCGAILEKEILRKRVLKKDLSEFIGTSPQNLSKMLRKDSLDVATLERFCLYLDLDPADFFDFRPEYTKRNVGIVDVDQQKFLGSTAVNISNSEMELMKRLLDEKDARIASLERTIDILLGNKIKGDDNSAYVSTDE